MERICGWGWDGGKYNWGQTMVTVLSPEAEEEIDVATYDSFIESY